MGLDGIREYIHTQTTFTFKLKFASLISECWTLQKSCLNSSSPDRISNDHNMQIMKNITKFQRLWGKSQYLLPDGKCPSDALVLDLFRILTLATFYFLLKRPAIHNVFIFIIWRPHAWTQLSLATARPPSALTHDPSLIISPDTVLNTVLPSSVAAKLDISCYLESDRDKLYRTHSVQDCYWCMGMGVTTNSKAAKSSENSSRLLGY